VTQVLSLDAADERAPSKVFDILPPGILVLCGGAFPPSAPLHELSWQEFSLNWEADTKIAFHFCKAALSRPLPAGSSVVLISSGAALAESPNSGGYHHARRKRDEMQTQPKAIRFLLTVVCDEYLCALGSGVRRAAPSIPVLTIEHGEISALTLFLEPRLFQAFGLAPVLADAPRSELAITPHSS
jgi:hypothetical protein